MAPTPQDTARQNPSNQPRQTADHKIDRNAPAGSKNSLGEESIRDGRPSTDDSIVEAIDELGPGTTSDANTNKR